MRDLVEFLCIAILGGLAGVGVMLLAPKGFPFWLYVLCCLIAGSLVGYFGSQLRR